MFLKNCIVISAVVLFTTFSAYSENKTFTGPSGGNWHNSANWNPPGVPTFDDDVLIGSGVNVNAEGLGVEANQLINEGQIDNAGHVHVLGDLFNDGIINNAGDVNVGDFANFEGGEINGVVNIAIADGMMNDGLIQGQEGVNLNIEINLAQNDSAFGLNEENGQIIAQGENVGILIVVKKGEFFNRGNIQAPGGIWIGADDIENQRFAQINGKRVCLHARKDILRNAGQIVSSGGTAPGGMGDRIEIFVFNPFGNGTFINSGTIQGGNGNPGQGGDHIYISADIFRNLGFISSGLNGTGALYGGYVNIKAKKPEFMTTDSTGKIVTPVEGTDQGVMLVCDSTGAPMIPGFYSKTTSEPLFRTNNLYILGRKLIFGNLPLSNIFASDYMEIFATNGSGNVLDFSRVTAGPIFAGNPGGSINIRGSNLIPPPIGYNAMCEPDPTVSSGSISNPDASVIGETVISFTGHTGTFDVMIRNEHANSRSFNYTVSSMLGWFAPISGTTPELDPWETFNLTVNFTVPSGLSVTTVDTVTSSAYIMPLWERHKSNIIAFPFDTLHYLPVAESRAEVPKAMTISAYPNPFNSAVRITLDGVGAGPAPALVEIFDLNGRRVAQLPEYETVGAGLAPARNDGANDNERDGARPSPTTREFIWSPDKSLTSGVYLVRACFEGLSDQGGATAVKRVVFIK